MVGVGIWIAIGFGIAARFSSSSRFPTASPAEPWLLDTRETVGVYQRAPWKGREANSRGQAKKLLKKTTKANTKARRTLRTTKLRWDSIHLPRAQPSAHRLCPDPKGKRASVG